MIYFEIGVVTRKSESKYKNSRTFQRYLNVLTLAGSSALYNVQWRRNKDTFCQAEP